MSLDSPRTRDALGRGGSGLPPPQRGLVALVTGASSGIGAAFAQALAARGHDVVLVARGRDRLEALAHSLEADGRRAHAVAADLRRPEGVEAVLAFLAERRLGVQILVNNAGFGAWGRFHDEPLDRQLDQLRLHADATIRLSHALAPGMVERGEGAIVNVGSLAALLPVPYLAVYSGSKAFVHGFSEALGEELRPLGVAVHAVHPGAVETDFGRVSGIDPDGEPGPVIAPRQVAEEALHALERKRRTLVPDRRVRVMLRGSRLLPWRMLMRITERAYRPPGVEGR